MLTQFLAALIAPRRAIAVTDHRAIPLAASHSIPTEHPGMPMFPLRGQRKRPANIFAMASVALLWHGHDGRRKRLVRACEAAKPCKVTDFPRC